MTNRVDLAEYIRRTVADAPPLSAEQRDRLGLLLRPDLPRPLPAPTIADAEAQRLREQERARQAALQRAQRMARDVVACDMCSAPPEAHTPGMHVWQPGRMERLTRKDPQQ